MAAEKAPESEAEQERSDDDGHRLDVDSEDREQNPLPDDLIDQRGEPGCQKSRAQPHRSPPLLLRWNHCDMVLTATCARDRPRHIRQPATANPMKVARTRSTPPRDASMRPGQDEARRATLVREERWPRRHAARGRAARGWRRGAGERKPENGEWRDSRKDSLAPAQRIRPTPKRHANYLNATPGRKRSRWSTPRSSESRQA